MASWLSAILMVLLAVNLGTSTPVAQSSVFVKLVSQPHGLISGSTGKRIVLGPRRVLDLQNEQHHRNTRTFDLLPRGHDNPEAMWPNGVFLPPDDDVQQLLEIHNLGQALAPDEDPDPLLLTGSDAVSYVTLLFSHGELFFEELPHERALMRNQQERRLNGLDGNRLGSNRPESPFYRWRRRQSRRRTPYSL